MMWKVFIYATPLDYQKGVDQLQAEGWSIQMIGRELSANNTTMYVVTASRPVNSTPVTVN